MLDWLLGRKAAAARPDPAIPAGERVYAIGDVHGRLDLLTLLLAQIDADDAARPDAATSVIFLGDLVDRGPDSAGVIAAAMAYRDRSEAAGRRVRFLMGNHEEMFLESISGNVRALRYFVKYGGRETILSYGLSRTDYDALDFDQLADRLLTLVPRAHADFVRDFEHAIIIGDYAFVHAGIRPGTPIAEQAAKDMRWIREDFLASDAAHEKMIVFGHTIFDAVDRPGNRIGVDTGAYRTGILSAVALEGAEQRILQAVGEPHPEWAKAEWAG